LEKCGIFLFHSFSLQPELLNINGVLFFWSKAGFGIDETSIDYFTISNCLLIRILLIGHALIKSSELDVFYESWMSNLDNVKE